MENTWIFYALAGLLALGIGDFVKKLLLAKGLDKDIYMLVGYTGYVIVFFVNMFIQGTGVYDSFTLQSGIIMGINNFFIPLGFLLAFKHLDIGFSLVTMRLITSFALLFIGIYLLGDALSIYNIIGFFIGAIAIFLLSGFHPGKSLKLNKLGLLGVFLGTTASIFQNAYFKYIVADINVHDFMLLQFGTSLVCVVIFMLFTKKLKQVKLKDIQSMLPYAGVSIICFVSYFLCFLPNIYLLGPLSLGYKILSYSLVVPILLSVIFLGDPINKKRVFAFTLTIVSIFLFLI